MIITQSQSLVYLDKNRRSRNKGGANLGAHFLFKTSVSQWGMSNIRWLVENEYLLLDDKGSKARYILGQKAVDYFTMVDI